MIATDMGGRRRGLGNHRVSRVGDGRRRRGLVPHRWRRLRHHRTDSTATATSTTPTTSRPCRPRVMGTHGVISSGHYLATQAGYDVLIGRGQRLRRGGDRGDGAQGAQDRLRGLDRGRAPHASTASAEDRVITRVGAGTSPALATLDYFLEHGKSPSTTR